MRTIKLIPLALSVLALGACSDDSGVTDLGAPPPAALVRFINAVPDTGTVDLRFWDEVENLPLLLGVASRAHSGYYMRVNPGARKTRVFPNSTDPKMTQIFLVDTTVTLNANTRYTLVYAGRATGNADRLAVVEDPSTPPAPAGLAIQAMHVAVGTGNVDVYVVPVTSTTATTPADFATNNAGVLRNVAYLGKASAYLQVPVRPSGGFYRFVVTAAGSTTALFAVTPNLAGAAAPSGATYGAQPGVQIAGSVLTAVIAPGTIPGTRQSTAANQTPTVFLMIDKVLNP